MADKRMLILPFDLVKKIDDNRGDMGQAEFIEFLISNQLSTKAMEQVYATKDEIKHLEIEIKDLLKSFLNFFLSYGLDLGKESPKGDFEELSSKLHGLESELAAADKKGEAKIKWK